MAYDERPVGGTGGHYFRVWVSTILVERTGAAQNYERWRAEGGVKKIAATSSPYWNNYNQATFNLQLGMNGVGNSGNFSYNFGTGAGQNYPWGTGTTTVHRNSAGVGFGFTARMDVNMANGPYLTSGWVTVGDSVATVYREANLTALSMDAGGIPATDEGPIWLEFSNPGGATVQGFIDSLSGGGRLYTSGSVGSRFNFPNLAGGSLTTILQNNSPNSNTSSIRIGIYSQIGGHNTYDYRDRPYTIKNNLGQANPTYADFEYLDENATTVAITGSDQVLVQGKSDLKVTVPIADKATANKGASMASYLFSIGAYSQSQAWSNTVDVVQDIGVVSDVSGDQTVSVRALDSRGNGTTVTKNVTVLPYFSPGFYNDLAIRYSNDFDVDDGLTVNLLDDSVIGAIAPMTLGGIDKNEVTPVTGLRYTIAKDVGGFDPTWTNIPFTVGTGTGIIEIDPVALATSIEGRMNSMVADNTVRWYILFEVTDVFNEPQYFEAAIDVGRPFFRIGADGRLYYKEIEFFRTFSGKASTYQPSNLIFGGGSGATWSRTAISNYAGWARLDNGTSVINNFWTTDMYLPAGQYQFVFYLYVGPNSGIIDLWIQDEDGLVVLSFDPVDLYFASESVQPLSTDILPVEDGKTYQIVSLASAKKNTAPASTGYRNAVVAIIANRAGDMP